MPRKLVAYSAIAIALGFGLTAPSHAQTEGVEGAVGGVTGAIGGATEGVTGRAGDVTADQGGQNRNVGAGQVAGAQQGRQAAGQANFGNLIAALNNVSVQAQNVRALENVNVVDVVDVNNVASGNNVQILNNALNKNDVDINVLRDAINDNKVLNNALQNANVNVNDVVAVNVLSGGDIVVFTR
ncbi:hypothetical protein ACG873_19035 [Mesorhizobium sp. AaZ16]|uniref:hypothetical protein n=1 Tax=Mesorhizobium sp. AaZ16 TaxID=3402289 RepID=UPI00374F2E29